MRLSVDLFLNEMIKYPKLKYLCSSKAPFYDQKGKILNGEEYDDDILALTKKVFDLKRSFVSNSNGALLDYRQKYYHDQRQGKDEGIFTNLSTLMIYRGFDCHHKEVIKKIQNEKKQRHFMSDIMSTNIIKRNEKINCWNKTVVMIANSTLIKKPLDRVRFGFSKMLKRKTYLHWFTGEGMEETEFDEAYHSLQDLINEYQQLDQIKINSNNKYYASTCSLMMYDSSFFMYTL